MNCINWIQKKIGEEVHEVYDGEHEVLIFTGDVKGIPDECGDMLDITLKLEPVYLCNGCH